MTTRQIEVGTSVAPPLINPTQWYRLRDVMAHLGLTLHQVLAKCRSGEIRGERRTVDGRRAWWVVGSEILRHCPDLPSIPPPPPPTAAELMAELVNEMKKMRSELHRLIGTVNAKLSPPVETLTTAQAAERVKCTTSTIRKWVALGYLSDRRTGMGRGAHLILADELEVFITDGPDACKRFRERMGRL